MGDTETSVSLSPLAAIRLGDELLDGAGEMLSGLFGLRGDAWSTVAAAVHAELQVSIATSDCPEIGRGFRERPEISPRPGAPWEFSRTACGLLTVRLYRMFPPTSFAHKLIVSTLSCLDRQCAMMWGCSRSSPETIAKMRSVRKIPVGTPPRLEVVRDL